MDHILFTTSRAAIETGRLEEVIEDLRSIGVSIDLRALEDVDPAELRTQGARRQQAEEFAESIGATLEPAGLELAITVVAEGEGFGVEVAFPGPIERDALRAILEVDNEIDVPLRFVKSAYQTKAQ